MPVIMIISELVLFLMLWGGVLAGLFTVFKWMKSVIAKEAVEQSPLEPVEADVPMVPDEAVNVVIPPISIQAHVRGDADTVTVMQEQSSVEQASDIAPVSKRGRRLHIYEDEKS